MVARSPLAFPLAVRSPGLVVVLVVVLVALAVAGCGKEPAPSAPASSATATPGAAAPEAPAASEPASEPAPSGGGRRGAAAATTTGEEPYDSTELGALHGTIHFEGKVPERFPLGAAASNECKHHPEVDQRSNIVLVEDGMLANVFVTLDSGYDRAKVPPAPAESVTLAQQGCMYVPRVLGLRVGQTLRVSNDDPTTHNVHTRAKRNAELNRNMGNGQPALEFTFDKAERPVPFQCDIHPWMGAAVFVEEHPWFAVSDAQGRFRIRDVPPGNYEVEAIHETLGKVSGKVTVKAGSSSGIALTLPKK